ncbi:class E sortase [Streptomyces sp. 130]|uniref:class E sortase n=1 Tax=Streptomyces sp. 130 TaxID=2591006 RepID=UPI00117D64D0|nr:class E sortase [Streptomyces sp. 130]TRV76503.1 class E sortase [Streptomyces sp. 130]
MTPPRHGAGAGQDDPHDQRAYEDPGAFEAAVHRLADPLNDPLPGPEPVGPWQQASYEPQGPQQVPQEWYDPVGYQRDWYGQQSPVQQPLTPSQPAPDAGVEPATEVFGRIVPDDGPAVPAPRPEPEAPTGAAEAEAGADTAPPAPPPAGGRAERRRAAKGRGRRRPAPRAGPASAAPAKPMTRMEARRAAKAAKDSPAIVISRGIGELLITLGVLMLLFVTYQLWWTNVRADQIAGREAHKIQDDWARNDDNTPKKQEAFEPGQGFAIIHIPKLDVVTPIAEGTSKEKVLDRGMVGHYSEKPLKTAMPSDKQGNFALAGHRNTHGEPFRYINRLKPGDPIVVETREAYYTYEMTSVLPQTSPSNVSVIAPVPKHSGFTEPGRYITLTTCTPEFTSTYRLIVWGKMVDERPRSEGKPDALAD